MKNSWFRTQADLDAEQKKFTLLPVVGKYFLDGPPGSGKTNLLLLRAALTSASGKKNILIITYTNALAGFIRTGISSMSAVEPDQVKTYHSWAFEHIGNYLGAEGVMDFPEFDGDSRKIILDKLLEANKRSNYAQLYDAIFVDESQDFTFDELRALLCLSRNVCICGDLKQGIYQNNGLDVVDDLGLVKFNLKNHFRIGHAIARVADRIHVPKEGVVSLEDASNYDLVKQGESSAKLHSCADRDEQFEKMLEIIKVQLDAFVGDSIGVLCGKRDTCVELMERFEKTDLKELVCAIGYEDAKFCDSKKIYILTMHSSKGTEFRAVHLFGLEEIVGTPLQRRNLTYTAVTRAKTTLNAYVTGRTVPYLESAFAELKNATLDDVLPYE